MSPCKKTTAKKPLKHQRYEEHRFRNRDAFEAFKEFYKEVVIIVEREVDLESLECTFIPDMFRDRSWAFLLIGLVEVHNILIQEFFSNALMERDHLNCWVRGKEFSILTMSIQNLLQIRPVIPESSLPYDKRKTLVLEVVSDLRGERNRQSLHTTNFSLDMRTLAYIMLFNLYLVRNLTTLS